MKQQFMRVDRRGEGTADIPDVWGRRVGVCIGCNYERMERERENMTRG